MTEPWDVRLPARAGWSGTTSGHSHLDQMSGHRGRRCSLATEPRSLLARLGEGGGPRDGAQASAGVVHEPGSRTGCCREAQALQ